MPRLDIAGHVRDIDLVVFDKDGTLIDFDHLWAGKMIAAIAATLDEASVGAAHDADLEADLYRTLGADPVSRRVVPESPLAVASIPALTIVCAAVLYRHGLPWHEAETIAGRAFRPVFQAPPTTTEIRPVGDVAGLMRGLAAAGARLSILTTDDRLGTVATLPILGVERLIDAMVCGDDPIPAKPEPDGLLHLAALAGVDPSRVLMVGDSAGDMVTARRAGAALAVGVLSGTSRADHFAGHADVIVPDIHAIRLAS
ncbi:HAD family hydrolase [Prosthecomicrobium hirschii]|uniref:HAD family hydrolase n=1 Tax=Prosthecodimorpha hirschii TaxID=665126 RepID=UPI00221F89B2|nr:HAD family hydrolase [Prosthecomicrobium hirschii]